MKKLFVLLTLLLALAITANAQSTAVSGTVTDADGQTWNNGTFRFSTRALAQVPVTGNLSATGTYTSVSIPHTAATSVVGEVWTISVCPQFTNFSCFNTLVTVSGATQTINVTPSAIRINALAPYQPQPAAYLDTEITNGYLGFGYLNVTRGVYRTCSSVSGGVCTWTNGPGDANHSGTVTTGSGASIGSTILCPTANCPAGTYRVNAYIDITTACATGGTYIVNLIYTDDQAAKTVPINIQGTGTTPATGSLALSAAANFGQAAQIIRSTGATSVNYSTTAGACGSGGPMIGNLYLSVESVQ